MKISIVLTSFNRSKIISRTIESILRQTYSDWELIIVDDASTDDTKTVLLGYGTDTRIRIIFNEKNKGSSFARNLGVENATGDAIMIWDSDDILYSHALAVVTQRFLANPDDMIVSAPCKQVRKAGDEVPYKKLPDGYLTPIDILVKNLPNNEKVRVARSEVMKNVRYEAKNLDFMVNAYLIEQGMWYHISEPLGTVYLSSDVVSLTSNRTIPNPDKSADRAYPLKRYFDRFGTTIEKVDKKRFADLSYGLALSLCLNNDCKEGRLVLQRSRYYSLRNITLYFLTFFWFAPWLLKCTLNFKAAYLRKRLSVHK